MEPGDRVVLTSDESKHTKIGLFDEETLQNPRVLRIARKFLPLGSTGIVLEPSVIFQRQRTRAGETTLHGGPGEIKIEKTELIPYLEDEHWVKVLTERGPYFVKSIFVKSV